ncbi:MULTISPECIES: FKBP-type peptidyl-prolyl cis-trans isomerase [unclassified Caulobacter]|uniref:FKBP-type peptidyl-prolyl cis-trans isomerase n=1 Tax=unclassified Caulobacter TaxID=2648921 RepID=UPI0006F771F8|nr:MULTISPECIES: FKBP-type peptidyl-prolyl cis-trans isomerase [unclassified Caulobacter]KQV56119.1 peptidylprolyl isomerase [Caulobacter sp. Root342]KQV70706.1 peptidylprolyl isomerase [Caulobacter sp. Root343]
MRFFAPLVLAAAMAAGAAHAQVQPSAPPQLNAGPSAAALAGKAFLEKNAKAPGVVTLPSGLQYKVVTSGAKDAPSPKLGDIIKVHYEGKLLDGTVFDSSFARGKPAIMPADGLIPGWLEALPKMKVGDEWTLYIPSDLAYGSRDMGEIPPDSVLVFRLQLLGMLAVD